MYKSKVTSMVKVWGQTTNKQTDKQSNELTERTMTPKACYGGIKYITKLYRTKNTHA